MVGWPAYANAAAPLNRLFARRELPHGHTRLRRLRGCSLARHPWYTVRTTRKESRTDRPFLSALPTDLPSRQKRLTARFVVAGSPENRGVQRKTKPVPVSIRGIPPLPEEHRVVKNKIRLLHSVQHHALTARQLPRMAPRGASARAASTQSSTCSAFLSRSIWRSSPPSTLPGPTSMKLVTP